MRVGRLVIGRAILVTVMAVAASSSAAAQRTDEPPVPFTLHIERGPRAALELLPRDTGFLVPMARLFRLLELAVLDDSVGRVLARLSPSGPVIGADASRGIVIGRDVPIGEVVIDSTGRDLWVSPSVAAAVLGVRLDIDGSTFDAYIAGGTHLPIVMRLERERIARRDLVRPEGGGVETLRPTPRLADGAVIDWSFATLSERPTQLVNGRLAGGAQVLGGAAAVQHQQVGARWREGFTTFSWQRAWDERRWVRQLVLGDGAIPVRRGRAIRGVLLTNVPFLRRADFDPLSLSFDRPSGWSSQVRVNEQLVSIVDAGAATILPVQVPTMFGANLVEVQSFGPSGETLVSRRNLVVPLDRLPRGALEYAAAAGWCRFDRCRTATQGDVRWGATSRVTLQGGLQHFTMPTGPARVHPYGLVTAGLGTAFNVTLEGVGNGVVRTAASFDPNVDLSIGVDLSRFDTTSRATMVNPGRQRAVDEARVTWRPRPEQRALIVQATARRFAVGNAETRLGQAGLLGARGPWRLGVSAIVERAQFSGIDLSRRDRAEFTVDGPLRTRLRPLNSTFVRATIGVTPSGGLAQWSATALRNIGTRHRIEASWIRIGAVGFASLVLQTTTPWVQAVSANQFSGGRTSGSQQLAGSLLIDPRGRSVQVGNDVANGRSLGFAGVSGVVFLDQNANGERDVGEPGLADVIVEAGTQILTTDGAGRFRAGSLVAFAPATIRVDSLSFADPLWYAPRPEITILPGPNAFEPMLLPVVPGGAASGTVIGAVVRGAIIEARDSTGRVVGRAPVFEDGGFELRPLPPGPVTLQLAERDRARFQLDAASLRIAIGATLESRSVSGLTLRVAPADTTRR